MAITTKSLISAMLLLCLVLRGCESTGTFNEEDALAKARDAAAGKGGSDYKIFNVLDNGAKADGTTDSSMSFIRTFKEACNFHGNAMMVIPEGDFLLGPVIFQGPCFNPSPLIIQANGMLKAQSDLSHFGGTSQLSDWISFQNIDGLILSGQGTFDGQGADIWKGDGCDKSECIRMPATFKFIKIDNAILYGFKTIDPKGFHIMMSICKNIKIFNLNLKAPGDSPNTDGIHMSKSDLIEINDCVIATGDDCVSMIQGSTNINVNNVICGPGHGISVGSLGHYESEADVQGITVTNCSLTETDNGVRIKTYKTPSPSKANGIVFRDITMTRVKNPIIIDQEYGKKTSNRPSKVSIADIQYINIKGTSVSKVAVSLLCSSSNPCQGIKMDNVNLQFAGAAQANIPFSSSCTNAKVTYVGPQSPPPCR
ncbi:hypothetical protein REPUB_Repub15cG0016300 [Reevesia pubescens]